MQDKVTERREARQKREREAVQHITQATNAGTGETAQQRLATTINHLYADWFNASTKEHADDMTEDLAKLGVTVSIAHYTGDSSFPTEYTIKGGDVRGLGPTFDMALLDWIAELLKRQAKG